ncbi:MAG: putative bifunctional diguanylate cyclase/phosphodiesterase [Acidimicrobiales bacterium]
MSDLTKSDPLKVGDEARLVVETLHHVTPRAEIVAVVTTSDRPIPGFHVNPIVSVGAKDAFELIRERVHLQLNGKEQFGSFTWTIDDTEWGILVEPIELISGQIVGALLVARYGRVWSQRELSIVKAFGGLFGKVASQTTREGLLLHQRSLDELVSQVAERLMSATAATRVEALTWTTRVLAEFLDSDVAFLRRNDHVRGLSILEAQWPPRDDFTGPDPLGEVRFDSDPLFMATKDLREPYLAGIDDKSDEYMERVEEGVGADVNVVMGAAVPLVLGDSTWGVLGFIHFELRAWKTSEINALQAVASMLVQLQARIDAEERTAYIALHDDLTDLPNRRALLRELKSRRAAGRDTAVLIIDLDRFKVMNDFLGHANGDRLLVTIADRVRTSIRVNDYCARLGGDEFVVLLDEANSEMEVLASAYRLLELVAAPVDLGGQLVSHTASIGIAIAGTKSNETDSDVLANADGAMYVAKAGGRNKAVLLDEKMRADLDERSAMELMLREALENGELRLHYQPEVDLRNGRLLSVEALLRWAHPTKGLMNAAEFITIAEETGLVLTIGRWVFAEACRQLAEWRANYPDLPLIVRVNMSPAEFAATDLVEFVEGCLAANDITGERLCIEITEYAVVDEPEKTASILRGFQEIGVEVAIDDFGTGFASMTELKHLPADILKLDMSFVGGITTDAYDRAIVESIIRLGQVLNLGVTAEGIERVDTIEELLRLGCHRGQGYLISRPVAPNDLHQLLDAGKVPASLLRPEELTLGLASTTS